MIHSIEIQNLYIELYTKLREYFWNIKQVECIVDLEISIFKQFPDLKQIQQCITKLKVNIQLTLAEDKELRDLVDKLEQLIQSTDKLYAPIKRFQEVVPV